MTVFGLSEAAGLLNSLLIKLCTDVCVTLAFLGLSFPIFEMGRFDGPSPVHRSVRCRVLDEQQTFPCKPPPPHCAHLEFDEARK